MTSLERPFFVRETPEGYCADMSDYEPWTTEEEFQEVMDRAQEQVESGQTVSLGDFTQYVEEG